MIKLPIGQMNVLYPDALECQDRGEEHVFNSKGMCIHCEYECEHGDLDNGWCLDCEMDLSEDLACKAYDSYKDRD